MSKTNSDSRFRRFLLSPATSMGAFALAAVLLLTSGVGGARAALQYYSDNYVSRVQMYDIGVSLLENGTKVSYRDYVTDSNGQWNEATGVLLGGMLAEGETLKLGKTYSEAISVQNSGTINQYVRVSVYKYWLDTNGSRMTNLSPALIHLNLITGGDWVVDEAASTPERTVLYYTHLLNAGETTSALSDTIAIDTFLASKVTQTRASSGGKTTITTKYDYNGVQFVLEATVDAVQEHNAQDAILSAWGREVSVSGNTLSLK